MAEKKKKKTALAKEVRASVRGVLLYVIYLRTLPLCCLPEQSLSDFVKLYLT